jgi:hypothetical protein
VRGGVANFNLFASEGEVMADSVENLYAFAISASITLLHRLICSVGRK